MSKSIVLKNGKAFVNINGKMTETTDAMLIGCAVLDMLEQAPETNYNDLRKIFHKHLLKNNHRQTPERYAVLEEICNTKEDPFNAKLIYHKMQGAYVVSLQTVYSAFSLLLEANIIEISSKVDQPKIKGVFKTTYFELKGNDLKMSA